MLSQICHSSNSCSLNDVLWHLGSVPNCSQPLSWCGPSWTQPSHRPPLPTSLILFHTIYFPPHTKYTPAPGPLHLLYLYSQCSFPGVQVPHTCTTFKPWLNVASSGGLPQPPHHSTPCSGIVVLCFVFIAMISADTVFYMNLPSMVECKVQGSWYFFSNSALSPAPRTMPGTY